LSKRVILVDDSKTILITAEMALQELIDAGLISLKTYTDPASLLYELVSKNEDYDLLVSDINMPQMSGLDLSTQLKHNEDFKDKPILILTTESSQEMKLEGKKIGVTGWLVKPFSNEKLVKSIKMVLGI